MELTLPLRLLIAFQNEVITRTFMALGIVRALDSRTFDHNTHWHTYKYLDMIGFRVIMRVGGIIEVPKLSIHLLLSIT